MPELRGHQATEEVKQEWAQAYKLYLKAPGDPRNQKNDRAERIEYVAKEMKISRISKQSVVFGIMSPGSATSRNVWWIPRPSPVPLF